MTNKCRCEDSTGWTAIRCCNVCGLPDKSETLDWRVSDAPHPQLAVAQASLDRLIALKEEQLAQAKDEIAKLRDKLAEMAKPAVQGVLAKMAARSESEVIEAMRKNLAILDRVKNQRDNYRVALCEIMEITAKQQLPITAQIHECANEALERKIE
jgi:cysteinyl-tRNA synthetase